MKSSKAAIRYARSLFSLALAEGKVERVKTDVDFLLQALHESRDLRMLLASPVVREEKKTSILREVFGNVLSADTFSFLQLLTSRKREGLLEEICLAFMSLFNHHKGLAEVVLTTAIPADEAIRESVRKLVSGLTDKTPVFTEVVDSSIIGGFVLRLGDTQIDASVSGKLQQAKNQLQMSVYSSTLS